MTSAISSKAEKPDLTGCRILLVEDEYFIADDLSRALQECGAEIIGPIPNLEKALPLAEKETLTCAVLDLNLRGQNGLEVARVLHRRNVPFVFSTGYTPTSILHELKEAVYLEKPYHLGELLRIVDRMVRHNGPS